MGRVARDNALPRAGRGHPRTSGRQERYPEHAHRFGQVDGRTRAPFRQHRAWPQERVHLPHQGTREREVDGALQGIRARERGAFYRRRDREPRRPHPVLHRRNFKQHGALRRRETHDYRYSDGRVPLLFRPRARSRLANTALDAPAVSIPPDERDRRRNGFF